MLSTDGDHSELDDYTNNEQGGNCSSCHRHDYDGDVSTADGFVPLQCDGCHTYPPTTNAHGAHVSGGTTGYAYGCGECHSGNVHNEAGVQSAAQYDATAPSIYQVIDVNFGAMNPEGSYPVKGVGRTSPG